MRRGLPDTKIIAAQAELRFYEHGNKWNAPTEEQYKKRRDDLNKFLNRLKIKDGVLIIAGTGKLDNKIYYRDAVHLNSTGIGKYFNLLQCTSVYHHRKTLR